MKKILYCTFFCLMFFIVGCSNNNSEKKEDLKEAVILDNAKQESLNNQIQKDEKIKDINAVINYINNTNSNEMFDQHGEKLTVFENFETHYFDFTGEGNEDVAIVTWEEDNTYLPVLFVTTDIYEDEYFLINSDFRGSEGDKFFCEGNFIIKDDPKNQSYDIAYNINNEFIKMATRYITYGDIKQTLQADIGIYYTINNNIEKIDSFNKLNVHSIYTYYDETGKGHIYDDIIREYSFNKERTEFDMIEKNNMESISLENLVGDNFIVGSNNSLKTFDMIYNESDLETAINYYIDNRTKFNKQTRIKYIKDYEEFINPIITQTLDEVIYKDERITEGNIDSVSVAINPIPKKVESVFKVVKQFFVPDESSSTKMIISNGYYTITCINSDMTRKINLMLYDKDVLITGQHSYGTKGDGNVDVEFENQNALIDEIKYLVYPTILIDNLSQIDEVKYKNIWKANVVVVPEKTSYY